MPQLHGQTSFYSHVKLTPVGFDTALRLLYIEESDEPVSELLHALGPEFRWNVTHAPAEKTAREISAKQPVDVALISATMPDLDIPMLATELTNLHPKIVIFVLAPSIGANEQAFVSGRFQILLKPCDPQAIIQAVARMASLVSWLTNNTTLELVSGIHSLPTIPQNYQGVIRTIQSPHSSFQEIGDAVNKDMGITSRVLQVANSAYYGYTKKITNPTEAALLLGVETLKSLIRYTHLLNNFPHAPAAGAIFDRVWRHSVGVGSVARKITLLQTQNESLAEEAFTAGLLHDIGKMALMSIKPEEYTKLYREAAEGKTPMHLLERVKLGTTHAEMGAYLLSLWGIPYDILEAVAWHHFPAESRAKEFSPLTAVHVANVSEHLRTRPDRPEQAPILDERYLKDISVWPQVEGWMKLAPDTPKKTEEPGGPYIVRPAAPTPEPQKKYGGLAWAGVGIAAVVIWLLRRFIKVP